MKQIILLSLALLLSVVCALAQSGSGSDNASETNSERISVVGCLDGAIGKYSLTNSGGTTYQLAGKTEELKPHIGETVRVMGVLTPVVNEPGAMSEGTQTEPTLSIISLTRISQVCSDMY